MILARGRGKAWMTRDPGIGARQREGHADCERVNGAAAAAVSRYIRMCVRARVCVCVRV